MSRASRRLFVYGTLRRGGGMAHLLGGDALFLGNAKTRGRLYSLGEYPGLRPATAEDQWVTGELFEIAEERLPHLDAYEGREYKRRFAAVVLDSGEEHEAWVYYYLPAVGEERRIVNAG